MLWENLREEEFEGALEKSGKVCVVPIGCLEMHGQHLPVGTDTITCSYIAQKAAEIEPVCVFPGLFFGDVNGLTMHKGTIILSTELLMRMLDELCAEIARNGFKKIILLNGHGGNTFILPAFVRSTMHDKKDYVVMCRNEWAGYGIFELARDIENGVKIPELTKEDMDYVCDFAAQKKLTGHGCINETSVIMAIRPETVRLDRMHAAQGLPTGETDYLAHTGLLDSSRFWLREYPDSYSGHDHEKTNARIGAAILRRRIEAQAEACRLVKQDDRILDWNDEWNHAW